MNWAPDKASAKASSVKEEAGIRSTSGPVREQCLTQYSQAAPPSIKH